MFNVEELTTCIGSVCVALDTVGCEILAITIERERGLIICECGEHKFRVSMPSSMDSIKIAAYPNTDNHAYINLSKQETQQLLNEDKEAIRKLATWFADNLQKIA